MRLNSSLNFINKKSINKTCTSNRLCLSIPARTSTLKFTDRSFRKSSFRLWNSLPTNLGSFSQLSPATTTTSPSLTPLSFAQLSLSCNQLLSCLKIHIFSLSLTYSVPLPTQPQSAPYVDAGGSSREYTNILGFAGAI